VNLAVLRSFEKAQYAPLHIGHYALASTHYCHFTSPIRRYADLMVHRTLECYLQNKSAPKEQEQNLVEAGKHITFAEQRAEDAERELTKVLTLQMLSKKIGEQLDCVVTGLTGFGVFVQCRKFGIEGLIRMDALGQDQWKYNEKTQSIVGERSGRNIRLGQAMKVRIISVNIPARQLNVTPAESLAQEPKQSHRRKKRKTQTKTKRRKKN
jgi:ribonuclease R